MFYDLNVPWPSRESIDSDHHQAQNQSGKIKGKGKAKGKEGKQEANHGQGQAPSQQTDCFKGLNQRQKDEIKSVTEEVMNLGYSVIAYNHVITSKFNPSQHFNPFYSSVQLSSIPPFPSLDPRSSSSSSSISSSSRLLQLSRLTVNLDSASIKNNAHNLSLSSSSTSLLSYDLLSVKPFDESSFSLTCLTLTDLKPTSIDIISLDLSSSNRLPFFLKRSTVNKALDNGAVFEVCWGETLTKPSQSTGTDKDRDRDKEREEINKRRRNLISCTRDLLRQTNGKGVILSSGVSHLLGLRGPSDVVNLAYIFGMTPNAARDSISANCRSLIVRAQTRKTYRGLISAPKLVTRVNPPSFPTANPNGVGDGVALVERNRVGRAEQAGKRKRGAEEVERAGKVAEKAESKVGNEQEDGRKKNQLENSLEKVKNAVPNPGFDMLGIGGEIGTGIGIGNSTSSNAGEAVDSKVAISVGNATGNAHDSAKGRKRKLEEQEQDQESGPGSGSEAGGEAEENDLQDGIDFEEFLRNRKEAQNRKDRNQKSQSEKPKAKGEASLAGSKEPNTKKKDGGESLAGKIKGGNQGSEGKAQIHETQERKKKRKRKLSSSSVT